MSKKDRKKRNIDTSDNKEKQIPEKDYKHETTFDDESEEYLKKIQGNQQLVSDDDTMMRTPKEHEFAQEERITDQSHSEPIEHQLRETQSQNITSMYTYLLYFAYFVRAIQYYQ
jgi:hypothetical protein